MEKKKTLFADYQKHVMAPTADIPFIGPRALFDPNFVPKSIIPRIKPVKFIHEILFDAIEDGYGTNINLYGLEGNGKNLTVNHYLTWIQKRQLQQFLKDTEGDDSYESNKTTSYVWKLIQVDCAQQDIDQIFFSVIGQLLKILGRNGKLERILSLPIPKLWNFLKFLLNKIQQQNPQPIILYLRNSENLGKDLLNKFFLLSKREANFQIISSLNTGIRQYGFKQYSGIDHRIKLSLFDYSEILKITTDRATMSLPHGLSNEAIKFIVDLTTTNELRVPGSAIKFIREIYPITVSEQEITGETLRNVAQYYFEGFSLDAIGLADYLTNSTIEERLFLEYILNYFRKPEVYYISFQEIKNAFRMTYEELGYQPKPYEFETLFKDLLQTQILVPSHFEKNFNSKKNDIENRENNHSFNYNKNIFYESNKDFKNQSLRTTNNRTTLIIKEINKENNNSNSIANYFLNENNDWNPLLYNGNSSEIVKRPHYLTLPLEEINEILALSFGID